MRKSLAHIEKIASTLRSKYHDFNHYNKKNPLHNLLFVICSVKTDEAKYINTYCSLRRRFPRLKTLAEASENAIAQALKEGGLYRQKARLIRQVMDKTIQCFGKPSLAKLRTFSNAECESFLTQFPNIGKKVARCTMMYSLSRKVFPVDTHCWRISRRLGWISASQRDGRCLPRDMDRLQERIPPDLRFSLHVNMVSLGREYCKAASSRCSECPIKKYCPKIGVSIYY